MINQQIADAFARIRAQRPLIHHITNLVVMNDTANLTLHLGALPVMAHAVEEVAEMTAAAGALLLNLGTLTPERTEAMLVAGRTANDDQIPVVLDPVGAGATRLRTETALRLLHELRIAVVRGNAGEIAHLVRSRDSQIAHPADSEPAQIPSGTPSDQEAPTVLVRGVESVGDAGAPLVLVRSAARRWSSGECRPVAVITGPRDVLSDGRRALGVDNGHRWLTAVTGTGCMATTAIAAFCAVEPDPLIAAAGGLACLGLAAERAAQYARGPASFKVALLDAVYGLTPEDLLAGARIVELEGW